MKNYDIKLKWYERIPIVGYLIGVLILFIGLDFIDGTNSKAQREKSRRFDKGLRRTIELYNRHESLTTDELLTELQSIHSEARVILAAPLKDWGLGFYEMIRRLYDDPALTNRHAELFVEMVGWEEFRAFTDNSCRMLLLLAAQRIGLTNQMLPTLKSLLKMVKAQEFSPIIHEAVSRKEERELLTNMINALEPNFRAEGVSP